MLPTAAVLALAAVATLAGVALFGGDDPAVATTTAWTRPSPPGLADSAVYLDVTTAGDDALVAVTVEPDIAGAAVIHRSTERAGLTSMEVVDGALPIAAGETISFAPAGGLHLMLEDLAAPLVDGDRFVVTLELAEHGSVTVEVLTTPTAP